MRYLYLHGFASGPQSRKAQFFRDKLASSGVLLEIPILDQGDFEHLTITGQLDLIARELRGQPSILMGSSMGGYLAALYASQHPEIERMVLLAPAFGFASRWAETFGEDRVAEWRTRGWAEVYHYATRSMCRLSADLLNDSSRHPGFPECGQPTLIFHGVLDDVVPLAASETWTHQNRRARLLPVESGHELLDVLEWVWEQSRAFLLRTAEPLADTLEE
jgi:pimeloyl-ACP methyl ester carboxylesterase